jgi:OOP family OmpA-OmpF porin
MRNKLLLCGALFALSSTAVQAAPEKGDWTLSPQVGMAYYDGARDLDNGFSWGIGFGRWTCDSMRWSVNFNHFGTHNDTTNKDFSIDSVDAQVYGYFADLTKNSRAFAMGGLGAWYSPGQPEMPSVNRFADVGLGIDYRLGHRLTAQLDGRHVFARGGGDGFGDDVVMLSLNYLFKNKDKHRRRQASRLKEKFQAAGPVPYTEPLQFGFDSAKADAMDDTWQDVAQYLSDHASAKVILEGHADGKGPVQYNEKLALRRAEAVKEAIQSVSSVSDEQFVVRSKGVSQPVADNATEEGRALNRRVNAQVVPEGIEVDSWS